jgi:hypothetical protein
MAPSNRDLVATDVNYFGMAQRRIEYAEETVQSRDSRPGTAVT